MARGLVIDESQWTRLRSSVHANAGEKNSRLGLRPWALLDVVGEVLDYQPGSRVLFDGVDQEPLSLERSRQRVRNVRELGSAAEVVQREAEARRFVPPPRPADPPPTYPEWTEGGGLPERLRRLRRAP